MEWKRSFMSFCLVPPLTSPVYSLAAHPCPDPLRNQKCRKMRSEHSIHSFNKHLFSTYYVLDPLLWLYSKPSPRHRFLEEERDNEQGDCASGTANFLEEQQVRGVSSSSDILMQVIVHCGSCPMHYRRFCSIPGPDPLCATSTCTHILVVTKLSPGIARHPLGINVSLRWEAPVQRVKTWG